MSIVKRIAARFALRKSLAAFSKASKKSILKAVRLLKRLAPKGYKESLDKFRVMVENDHPGVELVRNIGQNIGKQGQKKLIGNLLVNQEFFGEKLRADSKEKHKVQIPSFIVISPTYACNLNCVGCYAGEYGNKYHLEPELVFDIVRQANDLGIYFFTISGGEPFAWPHMFEMFEKFPESYFLIYTNGTLLDEVTCARLAKLGNATPAISIEGFEDETSGRRGDGMYRTIMDAMARLRKHGVFFGASVTHTTANHDAVTNEAFWEMLVENGACYSWIFQYIPIGIKPAMSLVPTPQQRKERYETVHRVRKRLPILLADFWNDGWLVNGCMAGGGQYLHINAKGLVEPCVFQHFAVDDIRKKSLVEVLHAPLFKAIRREIPYGENLLAPCMIIDHPEFMKKVIEEYGAVETHEGAATIVNELHEELVRRSKEWKEISQELWERDYADRDYHGKGFFTYEGCSECDICDGREKAADPYEDEEVESFREAGL